MYRITHIQGVHPKESKQYKSFEKASKAFLTRNIEGCDTRRLEKLIDNQWVLIEEKYIPLLSFQDIQKQLVGFYGPSLL